MIRISLVIASLASPALAQQLQFEDAMTVLAEGRALSSTPLSEPFRPAMPGMEPTDTRMHEVFVSHGGNLYLCYLRGSTKSGTPPTASCYGNAP